MTLAEIVVDQLVFVLAAHDEVLDTDSAVDLLQSVMTGVADLSEAEFASVRQVAEDRLSAAGSYPPGIEDALRELVLLLDEVEAG